MCGIIRIIYHAFEEVNPTTCIKDITQFDIKMFQYMKIKTYLSRMNKSTY